MEAALKYNGPTYIRLTGTSNNPIVYDMDYDFKIGKSIKLKSGDDVTIFSCGSSVFQALKASVSKGLIVCMLITEHEIFFSFNNSEAVTQACKSQLIVSLEEHNVIGGLGSANKFKSTLKKVLNSCFLEYRMFMVKVGTIIFVKKHGLSADKIVEVFQKIYHLDDK